MNDVQRTMFLTLYPTPFALCAFRRSERSWKMDGHPVEIEECLFQCLWKGWMGLNKS